MCRSWLEGTEDRVRPPVVKGKAVQEIGDVAFLVTEGPDEKLATHLTDRLSKPVDLVITEGE